MGVRRQRAGGGTDVAVPGYAPSMKIFHTSDWHIGRTFHTHPTLDHFRIVAQAMAQLVVTEHVDVVGWGFSRSGRGTPAST